MADIQLPALAFQKPVEFCDTPGETTVTVQQCGIVRVSVNEPRITAHITTAHTNARP